jgi:hypothetical protein
MDLSHESLSTLVEVALYHFLCRCLWCQFREFQFVENLLLHIDQNSGFIPLSLSPSLPLFLSPSLLLLDDDGMVKILSHCTPHQPDITPIDCASDSLISRDRNRFIFVSFAVWPTPWTTFSAIFILRCRSDFLRWNRLRILRYDRSAFHSNQSHFTTLDAGGPHSSSRAPHRSPQLGCEQADDFRRNHLSPDPKRGISLCSTNATRASSSLWRSASSLGRTVGLVSNKLRRPRVVPDGNGLLRGLFVCQNNDPFGHPRQWSARGEISGGLLKFESVPNWQRPIDCTASGRFCRGRANCSRRYDTHGWLWNSILPCMYFRRLMSRRANGNINRLLLIADNGDIKHPQKLLWRKVIECVNFLSLFR